MEGDNLIILTEEVEKLQIQILPADYHNQGQPRVSFSDFSALVNLAKQFATLDHHES
jgi:hypothetical protein